MCYEFTGREAIKKPCDVIKKTVGIESKAAQNAE